MSASKKSAKPKPGAGKRPVKKTPTPPASRSTKTATKTRTAPDSPGPRKRSKMKAPPQGELGAPALLSGGNPQIAKGEGDAPVQAYISAMPEWKSLLGRRLDALIEQAVPGVRKAVKWNSPFYGVPGQGWFLSFHCFNKYVKVAFLRGGSLSPKPPGVSKHQETRYLDIYGSDELDEAQLLEWLRQSAAIPGWDGGSPRLNGGIAL